MTQLDILEHRYSMLPVLLVPVSDNMEGTPRQSPLPLPARTDSKFSLVSTASSSTVTASISGSSFATKSKTKEYMESLRPPSPKEFERIAFVQHQREQETKRRNRERRRWSREAQRQRNRAASMSTDSHDDQAQAARTIQKTFRGYRTRRELEGFGLDASTRWVTAIREAQFRNATKPRPRTELDNDAAEKLEADHIAKHKSENAREKWKKASAIARRAGHDDLLSDSSSSESSSDEDASPEERAAARARREKATAARRHEARMMGIRYFLEMVDQKHRYGSNLCRYHEVWKRTNTHENFFYWLDYGEGRNVEVDGCPRDRLEREQVRYLSREERQYYLVEVDNEGRLCWAKNGQRIDTTEQFKDSIHGVVPVDDSTPAFNAAAQPLDLQSQSYASSSSSESSLESEREADRAAKYATPGYDNSQGMHKVSQISASTIFNKMMRKSVRKNTWIFVADTNFRMYVGIKDSGAFQHSSFLQGSRISAAGLIKIKNGRLSSLSPLSGHYRPPASNFRAFVHSLRQSEVDMSHVSISKSYVVLIGLESYLKTKRKGKDLAQRVGHRKDKIVAPEEAARREEEAKDNSKSAEKEREVLQREEEEKQEGRPVKKALKKLGIKPTKEEKQAAKREQKEDVEQMHV
jgi:transposase